jgi:FHS family L-fucose permease-like MFS transporter
MGNFMNFFAYLFMGIPAGKMLTKVGYKKTALIGIAVGFIGVLIQYLSGFSGGIPGFCIYLFGAFISGFSVCILNTVVNPMLNLLGGGGNRGNQLNMIGGTLNSLAGTMTPMLVGALIGTVTASTQMADVNLVMYIAMTVFAAAFVALIFIPIKDPEMGKVTADTVFEHSPWSFRHTLLGEIAIFVYVGVEVGIPNFVNLYMTSSAIGISAAVAGTIVGMYWFLMLCGRLVGASVGGKVSSKAMMTTVGCLAVVLLLLGMFLGNSTTVRFPAITSELKFSLEAIPIGVMFFVLCGLCTSVMWGAIFNLAVEGLGKYTSVASGIFMVMVCGGGILPLIQGGVADATGENYLLSYVVILIAVIYIVWYALMGSKPAKTE